VTKPNGRNSNLAQSSCVALDGPSPVTQPFNSESQPFCDQLFFAIAFLWYFIFVGLSLWQYFFILGLAFLLGLLSIGPQPFCILIFWMALFSRSIIQIFQYKYFKPDRKRTADYFEMTVKRIS
jgi:hypothetical protein